LMHHSADPSCSNLRMAESKSAYFVCSLNAYSEKRSEFGRLRINRLAYCSEWAACSIASFYQGSIGAKPMPNFTRLDAGRPEIAILVDAMLRAREVVATRPWSTSQEATTEHWWADVLADPRARMGRGRRGFYDRDRRQTAQKSHYRLADEPSPVIEVACSKCEWKAGVNRAELLAMYGAECPLPTLLNHLAMPSCSRINTHWDRCGVYYVNPIDGRER
jgi:hypothetical protein